MTDDEIKIVIGCLIVLVFLNVLTAVYIKIKYAKRRRWDTDSINHWYFWEYGLIGLFHGFMAIIYGIGIIFFTGILIAQIL